MLVIPFLQDVEKVDDQYWDILNDQLLLTPLLLQQNGKNIIHVMENNLHFKSQVLLHIMITQI